MTPADPDAVVVDGPLDAHAHPLWHAGAYMPQSRSSQRVAPVLGARARRAGPRPLQRARRQGDAPRGAHGGRGRGRGGRARRRPRRPAARPRAAGWARRSCAVDVADAAEPRADGPFDRVLVDPPCSGLGTLQAKPDLRWRMTPERIEGLIAEQRRILAAATAAVRPGGVVVWSTCTLNPAENEELLAGAEGLTVTERLTLMPHETRSAGFQVTRLESSG